MDRLLLALVIIFASLLAGYGFRRWLEARFPLFATAPLTLWRKRLQFLAMVVCLPGAAMLSLWGLPRPDTSLLALPLLGVCGFALGGGLALGAARLLRLGPAQTGSLFCCGSFGNVGAVGSLVGVIFLGEGAIALAALYRLCEEMYFFGVVLPVARRYSPREADIPLPARPWRSPMPWLVVAALLAGIALNLCGIERPAALGPLASGLTVAVTVFFLFTIGLGLRLSCLYCYIAPCLAMCAIRFVGIPTGVLALAHMLGVGGVANGLALQTVVIVASMPVAMTALIPPSLLDLDLDLANACWIVSTLALVAVLPLLLLLLPHV